MGRKYIHAVTGVLLAAPILYLATLVVPRTSGIGDLNVILTISTFLFAMLAGFALSRASGRFDTARSMIAKEDANWLTLYNMSGIVGKEFETEIRDQIDRYYVAVFDHEADSYYKATRPILRDIYGIVSKHIRKVPPPLTDIFSDMQDTLQSLEEVRNTVSVVTLERISASQWAVLVALASLIIFSMFHSDIAAPYNDAFFMLFSLAIVAILLIIRDFQHLRFGGESLGTESGQEVLEDMGLLRYYHKSYLELGTAVVPPEVTKYRLGTHEIGQPAQIHIVDRSKKGIAAEKSDAVQE